MSCLTTILPSQHCEGATTVLSWKDLDESLPIAIAFIIVEL